MPPPPDEEGSTDQDLAVRLDASPDELSAPDRAAIDRAIAVEPPDATAGRASESREGTADQNLAVGLYDQDLHLTVGPGIKGRINTAVGIQPADEIAGGGAHASGAEGCECSANHDFAVRLERHRSDAVACSRIEAIHIGLRLSFSCQEQGEQ